MKKTIPFFILLIHSLTYTQDFKSPDAINLFSELEQQEKIHIHKVKKRYKYLYKFDTITNSEPEKILLGYTLYNENGQPDEKIEDNWVKSSKTIYKYNKKKQLTGKTVESVFKKAYFEETARLRDSLAKIEADSLQLNIISVKNTSSIKKEMEKYKYTYNRFGKVTKKKYKKSILYINNKKMHFEEIKIYDYTNIVRRSLDFKDEEKDFQVMCTVDDENLNVETQYLYSKKKNVYVKKNYRNDHYSVNIYYLNEDFKPYKKEYIYTGYQEVLKFSTYSRISVDVQKVEPDRNKMVNIINKRPEHSINTTLYKFDKSGNVIETFNSDPGILTGELYHSITHRYNDKELLAEEVGYKKDETINHRYRYDYEFYE